MRKRFFCGRTPTDRCEILIEIYPSFLEKSIIFKPTFKWSFNLLQVDGEKISNFFSKYEILSCNYSLVGLKEAVSWMNFLCRVWDGTGFLVTY